MRRLAAHLADGCHGERPSWSRNGGGHRRCGTGESGQGSRRAAFRVSRAPTIRRHGGSRPLSAAADVRQVVTGFRDALRIHQEELNRLNVYPVPDGDTGTNMTLTVESVVQALGTAEAMPRGAARRSPMAR